MENVLNKFSKNTHKQLLEIGVTHVSFNGKNKMIGYLSSDIIPISIQKIAQKEAFEFERKDKSELTKEEYCKIYIP